MTETPVESTVEAEEPKGPPVPEVSEPSAEKPTSAGATVDPAVLKEALKPLLEEFREETKRAAQSAVDKRAYQFDRVAKYLEEAKGDPRQAARLMALDELVERGPSEPEVPGRTKGAETPEALARTKRMEAKTAEILETAGIGTDDPEVAKLAEHGVASEDDWYHRVNRLVAKRAKQSAGVGAATAAGEPGRVPVGDDPEEIAAELAKLQSSGNVTDPRNIARRQELRERLRKASS